MERHEALKILIIYWVLAYQADGKIRVFYEIILESDDDIRNAVFILFGSVKPSEQELASFIKAYTDLMLDVYANINDIILGKRTLDDVMLNSLI